MKTIILGSLAVMAVAAATPISAQPRADNWQNSQRSQSSGWDRDAFWRNAPGDPRERITFMQRRIDRGIADGSLDRGEGRRAQRELNSIKMDARKMGRRYNDRQGAMLQARLDNLGQTLRWSRNDQRGVNNGGSLGWQSDPRFATQYDAKRYYRDDARYSERRLGAQDEVYRGSDGRYYCKRRDGTTGLIVGAAGGALLGNVIDGGQNRTAGTLIGGALGAILGKSIEQNNNIRCK